MEYPRNWKSPPQLSSTRIFDPTWHKRSCCSAAVGPRNVVDHSCRHTEDHRPSGTDRRCRQWPALWMSSQRHLYLRCASALGAAEAEPHPQIQSRRTFRVVFPAPILGCGCQIWNHLKDRILILNKRSKMILCYFRWLVVTLNCSELTQRPRCVNYERLNVRSWKGERLRNLAVESNKDTINVFSYVNAGRNFNRITPVAGSFVM